MRNALIVLLLALVLGGCHSRRDAPTGPFDFRHTRWGMSRAEVLASEDDDPIYSSNNRLLYATSVIDKRVMLEYHLGNDQLYRTRYVLSESHVVDNKYVADYRDIQSVLTAKYGKPKKQENIWKKGVAKRADLQPGVQVAIGNLSMVSSWETPDVLIVARLSGKDFKINCDVTYTSKAFYSLARKFDKTDPALGGQGGELGGAFGNEDLEKATRDF
jgi:hypothetical protein